MEIHSELKKGFQLERMILFTDAVFAIAITLLVIEIRVPEIPSYALSEEVLVRALWHLSPEFTGFVISFVIIGQYWTVHHRMFGFVVAYTHRLLWINLIFLMAVVLMPFSSAFYSGYIPYLYRTPIVLYVANISFLGFMNFLLWRYIADEEHKLTQGLTQPVALYYSLRAITVPIIFILITVIYFMSPKLAIFIPITIPIIFQVIFGRAKKKLGLS